MRKLLLLLPLLLWAPVLVSAKDNPVADPAAVVVAGNARFTVLTDRLIRMEWSEDGRFEDRATLAVVNRCLPVPAFKVSQSAARTVIRTGALTLVYKGRGKFTEENLSVSFQMPVKGAKKPATVVWKPGSDESGNLLGTARTLDRCKTKEDIFKVQGMDKGVISRDGWAVVDESARQIFTDDPSPWQHWVEARPAGERQDLYLFAYGHDYLSAIRDFARIGGQVPLPPRFAFGFWQSRYWSYADYEFVDMARRFRREDIPCDVMIIDMDWHKTWSLYSKTEKDAFGQKKGWTGYTWEETLFPDPERTLAELHDLRFKTALNLHPASGIQPYDACYSRFVADYTARTDRYDGPKGYVYPEGGWQYRGYDKPVGQAGEPAPVPFRISEKEWTEAYFNSVLHPLQKQGVDFWWLDWQQWRTSRYLPDLSITFWLNFTFFQDQVRQSASQGLQAPRPLIYHRWGGLGSHRYQVGFSGDTFVRWEALAMEPWFTATAGNVCYGYWGHDLGGHMRADWKTGHDGELFTRWLQYGVFTPIFKVHSSKSPEIERRFWNYPAHSVALKDAVRLRYSLSRYIYDAARSCHESGISICRPLYWYAPDEERSYSYEEEFFFGDRILATAVCQPADPATGLSERKMWFPEGSDWYDMATGRIYRGGTEAVLHYAINENPWFVRAGDVIPLASDRLVNLQDPSDEFRILVVPGDGKVEYVTTEDDGVSQAYEQEFATTRIEKESDAASLRLTVHPREGFYRGMNPQRKLSFILEGVYAPQEITVNGAPVPFSRIPQRVSGPVWHYDGASLAVVVDLPAEDAGRRVELQCRFDPAQDRSLLRGKKGLMGRLIYVTDEVKIAWPSPAEEYLRFAGCASMLSSQPQRAPELLSEMDMEALGKVWERSQKMSEELRSRLKAISIF